MVLFVTGASYADWRSEPLDSGSRTNIRSATRLRVQCTAYKRRLTFPQRPRKRHYFVYNLRYRAQPVRCCLFRTSAERSVRKVLLYLSSSPGKTLYTQPRIYGNVYSISFYITYSRFLHVFRSILYHGPRCTVPRTRLQPVRLVPRDDAYLINRGVLVFFVR